MSFKRVVRFVPKSDANAVLIGEPVDDSLDVGAAVRKGDEVKVQVYSGTSALATGSLTDRTEVIDRILSPLAQNEVGTIRCIGLNYRGHAEEAKMAIPTVPTLFLKPPTALADPWPAPTVIPAHTLESDSADFEAEFAIVIGKTAKNVSEADALSYVLGYTAANDVSSRASQFAQTQWCFSKGFDGSCPIGPVLVSPSVITDVDSLTLRGIKNGTVLQDSRLDDMIFKTAKLVSFVSQGTTLQPGTIIITGTPAGIGFMRSPKETLHAGDEFVVEIQPHIGSLYNIFENEQ